MRTLPFKQVAPGPSVKTSLRAVHARLDVPLDKAKGAVRALFQQTRADRDFTAHIMNVAVHVNDKVILMENQVKAAMAAAAASETRWRSAPLWKTTSIRSSCI